MLERSNTMSRATKGAPPRLQAALGTRYPKRTRVLGEEVEQLPHHPIQIAVDVERVPGSAARSFRRKHCRTLARSPSRSCMLQPAAAPGDHLTCASQGVNASAARRTATQLVAQDPGLRVRTSCVQNWPETARNRRTRPGARTAAFAGPSGVLPDTPVTAEEHLKIVVSPVLFSRVRARHTPADSAPTRPGVVAADVSGHWSVRSLGAQRRCRRSRGVGVRRAVDQPDLPSGPGDEEDHARRG